MASSPASANAGSGLAVLGITGRSACAGAGAGAGSGAAAGAAAGSGVGGGYSLASIGFSTPDLSVISTGACGISACLVAVVVGTGASFTCAIFADKPSG